MTSRTSPGWILVFGGVAFYVVWRMQGFAIWRAVETPLGTRILPNTFASVDHPFHVARAATLWQEVASGHVLRWIGQHQGGYPAEFYPLGAAWFEVVVRAFSFGTLTPEGAHTLAVIALFLLPGAAFVVMAKQDAYPISVALLALVLQISLPGGWYGGGYTELVQWGLVTNVAGATATLLALPAMISAMSGNSSRSFALASGLSAMALYCNPRSALGLAAIGIGALVAAILANGTVRPRSAMLRLAMIAAVAGLLAAPLLVSLLRFGNLYAFVRYSGYASISEFVSASRASLTAVVLATGLAGVVIGLVFGRLATRATAVSALVYMTATLMVAFVPAVAESLPQLEPTRLMPLQRFLLIYLSAAVVWKLLAVVGSRLQVRHPRLLAGLPLVLAAIILALLTRSIPGGEPDPASRDVPPFSLYPVTMSAQPPQFALESAVRAADSEAPRASAILVLGSQLSWHQQLWAPLWTQRPLYYDNWLWYWRLDHAGTPGYRPLAGHHYPDPEATLTRDYLDRFGIGAVVLSNALTTRADGLPYLRKITSGEYTTYLVEDPVPIVTFDAAQSTSVSQDNSAIWATSDQDSERADVRLNWFPRWTSRGDAGVSVVRESDGNMSVAFGEARADLSLDYAVQPLDWVARGMAALGVVVTAWCALGHPMGWISGARYSAQVRG